MKKALLFFFLIIFGTTNAQYTKLLDFDGSTNGSTPWGSALYSDGTFLYGMTVYGGTNDSGTIFKIMPDGSNYTKLLDFTGIANGSNPNGSLISDGIYLYGMTENGGTSNEGTVFKIMPDGSGYVKLLDFSGVTTGTMPNGTLVSDGIFLYGMASSGGTNSMGTIFKIKPDGSAFSKLLDFSGTLDGSNPGSLFFDGTYLYGMTFWGGTNGEGVIFKILPTGSGYTKLLDFSGTVSGANPTRALISDGTFLYGITSWGGTNNLGVVFKIMPDGSGYFKLLDFSGTPNGSTPACALIFDGTFLYGLTGTGGMNDLGTVFMIKPDGTGYTNIFEFAGAFSGQYPYGSLVSDGTFLYGMTSGGGINDFGVIFKLGFTTAITDDHAQNELTAIPNPFSYSTTLKVGEHLSNANLRVFNSQGLMVKQSVNIAGPTVMLSRENLPGGLYFVQVSENNKVILAGKLVITD